jgi:hypothetical protein
MATAEKAVKNDVTNKEKQTYYFAQAKLGTE